MQTRWPCAWPYTAESNIAMGILAHAKENRTLLTRFPSRGSPQHSGGLGGCLDSVHSRMDMLTVNARGDLNRFRTDGASVAAPFCMVLERKKYGFKYFTPYVSQSCALVLYSL